MGVVLSLSQEVALEEVVLLLQLLKLLPHYLVLLCQPLIQHILHSFIGLDQFILDILEVILPLLDDQLRLHEYFLQFLRPLGHDPEDC